MKEKIFRTSGIIMILLLVFGCGQGRRENSSGFRDDFVYMPYRDSEHADLGTNCPLVDFVAADGGLMQGDVFWPPEFTVLRLKADGAGYFLTYDDLYAIGISGTAPCNVLAARYGVNIDGEYTGSGALYIYYENRDDIVSDNCSNFIRGKATWAIIYEDLRYPETCAVDFAK